MTLALAVPVFILGVLLLLVAVPFRARASGAVHGESGSGEARLDWGWGLLSATAAVGRGAALRVAGRVVLRLDGRRRGRGRGRPERKAARTRPDGGRGAGAGLRRVQGALRGREALLRMAVRLARALHLRLRIAGTVGIGDPADTALLAGLLRGLAAVPGVELAVELDWVEETLDAVAECRARIWVAELLLVAGVLLLEREHRAALRQVFS